MRIVGGKFRGRTLTAPHGQTTRPTADRVREALFNILLHASHAPPMEGARVLDLFAGSGALGLEALSRGAAYCLFVEEEAQARGALRENIEVLGLTGVSKVWRRDATRLGNAAPMPPFQLIFADPPYGQGLGDQTLEAVIQGGWLDEGGLVVLEERASVSVQLPPQLRCIETRTYGETNLWFLQASDEVS